MEHMCSMCPFFTNHHIDLLSHLVKRHRNAAKFVIHCSVPGCGASYTNYRSFKTHCQRKHYGIEGTNVGPDLSNSDDRMCDDINVSIDTDPKTDMKREAAYILRLKAGERMSQKSVDAVIQATKGMFREKLQEIKNKIEPHVDNPDETDPMFEEDLFQGLGNKREQIQCFKELLGFVPPIPVKLGERTVNQKRNHGFRFVNKDVVGYIVPFKHQLKALLDMPEICNLLQYPTVATDLMTDVHHGTYAEQNDFMLQHDGCLRLCLYTDDFEIVNPIGSHRKKHKCTAFYWTLLNIPPQYRSKLSYIQLAGIAKTVDLKTFGYDKFLADFVGCMNELSTGLTLNINGTNTVLHGLLLFVLADTLAAQQLGGFKEGVGKAHRPCRTCDVERDQLSTSFVSSGFPSRDEQEHQDRVQVLSEVSKEAQQYWSMKYGVNGPSVLRKIPHFNVTKCILHDPMHVLLEGVVRRELAALLTTCMESNFFKLDTLNQRITNFEYDRDELRDKPQLIERQHIKNQSFAQTAKSMLVLITNLPFMVGDLVPQNNPNWQNFLRLLQITLLTLSPIASDITIHSLRHLVAAYNTNYVALYPSQNITPKHHYMIHLPDQLALFGPLRNHWCMRFEAKNGFFKLKRWFNFRNITKSLTWYHQEWMCYQMLGDNGMRSENYLYDGPTIAEGYTVALHSIACWEELVNAIYDGVMESAPTSVLMSPSVSMFGHKYTTGCVLLLSFDDLPDLCIVDKVLVLDHIPIFVCHELRISYFDSHLNAFCVVHTNTPRIVQSTNMRYSWTQVIRYLEGKLFVMLRNCEDNWTL